MDKNESKKRIGSLFTVNGIRKKKKEKTADVIAES